MNDGKTHFADDDTLAYIAELEEALRAMLRAAEEAGWPRTGDQMMPLTMTRKVLKAREKEPQ